MPLPRASSGFARRARVEAILAQHPAVARIAIIGLPDTRWGEAVTGIVILRSGTECDEPTLIAWARERLASFETPKRVHFVDRFPETVGGKIMKHVLRREMGGQ